MRFQSIGLLLAVLIAGTASAANAVNPVLDEAFHFRLGAAYLDAEGTFSSSISGTPSVDLNTGDLGLDDRTTTPYFGARWRFTDRWRLTFDYFGVDNDGSVRRDFDALIFGEISVMGFLGVATEFETDFYVAQVGYSFFKNDRAELGVGAGVHVVDFDVKLTVSDEINGISGSVQAETSDLTVPLPNLLGYGTYAFTPNLSLEGGIGWFGLDYDEYSGDLVALNASLEYRVTDHIGVGVGYTYIDMDLNIKESNRKDAYNLEYQGPLLYISAGF